MRSPAVFFDDGRCEFFCRRGHYAMDRQCDLCHHTCHECNEDSLFNCTSCEKDKFGMQRYLLRGECRASCPEGTFHASGGRCEPCAADCAVCAALEFCLRCRPGLSSRDGRCLPLLCADGKRTWWHPLGEVADPKTDDCQPCEEGCKKCQHTDKDGKPETLCMSCEDEYYKWGSDCYRFCPERSFSVEDSMVCYPCEDQHCINCDQSQCYWCEEGFSILDGDCVDYCKNGFFMDATEHECEPCHVSCRACGGPQYNDCDPCEDGLTLTAGTCLEQQTWALCPEKQYKNDQGVCEGCHPSCKTCTGLEKRDCHTCPPGRFLTGQQSCVFQCPSSWFANQTSGRCQSCLPGCEMCLDSLSCVQCHNGSAGLYLQDGQCVNNCDRGFLLEQQCHPCAPECTSCMLNASHCLSCAAQYLLFDHTCLGHCPLGFYAQEVHCLPCPPDCRRCSDDGLCQECAEFFFLHQDTCVGACPGGYYASEQECMHCHGNCISCNGPESDDCTSCQNPKAVRYCGECLNQCPLSTYYDQHTEECRDCAESCLTCSDYESSSCLSCKDNGRLDEMGHCVWYSQCSVHTYIDEKGQCLLCDPLCHRCSGPGKGRCLNCATLFLLNNTCIEECPAGYYGDREEMACKRCHESCVSCVGRHSVECVTCKPGQFYHGQSCVESCSEGHYSNTTSGFCERCEPSCSRCSGPSSQHCLGCREDYWYHTQSGRCLKACPLGYYHDNLSKTCRKCHPSCNTCNADEQLRRGELGASPAAKLREYNPFLCRRREVGRRRHGVERDCTPGAELPDSRRATPAGAARPPELLVSFGASSAPGVHRRSCRTAAGLRADCGRTAAGLRPAAPARGARRQSVSSAPGVQSFSSPCRGSWTSESQCQSSSPQFFSTNGRDIPHYESLLVEVPETSQFLLFIISSEAHIAFGRDIG
ncbi:unnamed protein product [Boreogadus saida]